MGNCARKLLFVFFLLMTRFKFEAMASEVQDNMKNTSINVVNHISNGSSGPTYAKLTQDPHANLPSSFTICSTIMAPILSYPTSMQFFILPGVELQPLLNVHETSEGIVTTFFYSKADGNSEKVPHVFSHKWVKGCASFNQNLSIIQWVVDGAFVKNYTFSKEVSAKMPTDLTGGLFLGGANNKVTNLNIFSTAHSVQVMEENTQPGKCIVDGDYLAWKDMQWTLYGQAVIETIEIEEPCIGEPMVDIYDVKRDQLGCMQFCEHLGSHAPSFVNVEELTAFQKLSERPSYKQGLMLLWVAIDDKKKEGEWRDHYTQQVMNHTVAWAPFAPNRGEDENCALLIGGVGLDDAPCEAKMATCMCKRRPQFFLKLRGLCNDSSIDTYYKPMNNLTDAKKLNFYGLRTTIEYDQERGLWRLSVTDENKVSAISKASLASFTLGRHNWTISGDRDCNEQIDSESYTVELKMSGCNESQFTCNDGQCVQMDERCDQFPHCRDTSDEWACDIFALKEGYNRNIPPVISEDGKKYPVKVFAHIDLLKLVDIDEEDYSIEIQFEITLKWKENRATYLNLKANNSLNALTQADIEKLWLPKVIYENTDQKQTTRLGTTWEWETNVEVSRDGKFTRSGLETIDEANIFKGDENTLIMSQSYTHRFQCQYNFQLYPFDTQVG